LKGYEHGGYKDHKDNFGNPVIPPHQHPGAHRRKHHNKAYRNYGYKKGIAQGRQKIHPAHGGGIVLEAECFGKGQDIFIQFRPVFKRINQDYIRWKQVQQAKNKARRI
jgi:hypothetical protein